MQPLLGYLHWDSKTANELHDGLRMTFSVIEWMLVVFVLAPVQIKYVQNVINVKIARLNIVNFVHKFCYLLFMIGETNRDRYAS